MYTHTHTKDVYMPYMCVYNLQSLIHLRCELLTKECKGGNDKKGDVGGVAVFCAVHNHSFDHGASAFALLESFSKLNSVAIIIPHRIRT